MNTMNKVKRQDKVTRNTKGEVIIAHVPLTHVWMWLPRQRSEYIKSEPSFQVCMDRVALDEIMHNTRCEY